ncbi:MAG: hypothetical protein J6I49_04535 [Bacteroidales bacterium]|nr:hypothetical protein [Bacteroidales bacterium]
MMKSIGHYIQATQSILGVRKAEKQDGSLQRPVVVIESDDWGSIRMPSPTVLKELKAKGHRYFDHIGYDRYDTLASNTDLEVLIEALNSVKDSEGNAAKLTMNCVVANPDFDKIRHSGFQEYHYELFTETLRRYPHHDRSFALWKEGMKQGGLHPQFHGREHLNPQMWLGLLQKGCKTVLDSFDKRVMSVVVDKTDDPRQHSLAAFNLANEEEYAFAKESVREGLDLFEQLFGYRSVSMIAPNYTWDTAIEDEAARCGVKYLQGSRNQRHSYYVMRNGGQAEIRHTGQRNGNGQVYMVRNCSFEPSENPKRNADFCMAQVEQAFKRGQAAIISSHRQNFIGELYPENRENNIKQFKSLLSSIVKNYPNVIFLTSDELGKMIETNGIQ